MAKKKSKPEEIAPWELTDLPVAPPGVSPADADLQKIIRGNYREPIGEEDRISAEIDGVSHRVSDIGSRGLGLIVPSLDGFPAPSLLSVTLHIGADAIALRGKITHVSPGETSGECHCGIEFIDLSPQDEQTLHHFLAAHHARLFGATSSPADPGRD